MTSGQFPTDPRTIRSFIMYDVLAKRAPFDGFKVFCEAIGNPNFDYAEYEFWYYRFHSGNLDLNDDRSLDPAQLKFDELPDEMLVKIVEQLDLKTRLLFRKVSRKMRQLSHKTSKPVQIHNIELIAYHNGIKLELDNHKMEYSDNRLTISNKKSEYFKQFDYGENSSKFAFSDFWSIMEIPRLEIGKLRIYQVTDNNHSKLIENLQRISENSSSKFHVADVETAWERPQIVFEILALLKPGILENITWHFGTFEEPLNVDKFASMEQFKQAQKIYIHPASVVDIAHLHHFYHFEVFKIRLNSIRPAEVVTLRDVLASSAHFRGCKIVVKEAVDVTEIRRILGFEEHPNLEDDEYNAIRENQILANRQEFLRILINEHSVYISKKPIERYGIDPVYQNDDSSDGDY